MDNLFATLERGGYAVINSAMAVYIILGNVGAFPGLAESPTIGLYTVRDTATGGDVYALVYADDNIVGGGSSRLKYTLGFLPKGGIGSISESGNFALGGGLLQNQRVSIQIRNTEKLKYVIDNIGVSLVGRSVYVVEYENEEYNYNNVTPNPLYAGRIDDMTWDETMISLTATQDFEVMRRANIMIDYRGHLLPVTFGEMEYGYNRRINEPTPITSPGEIEWQDIDESGYRQLIIDESGDRDSEINEVGGAVLHLNEFIPIPSDEDITVETVIISEEDTPLGNVMDIITQIRVPPYVAALDMTPFREYLISTYSTYSGGIFCVLDDNTIGVPVKDFYAYGIDYGDDDIRLMLAVRLARLPINVGKIPSTIKLFRPDTYFMSDGWPNWPWPLQYDMDNAYFINNDEPEPLSVYGNRAVGNRIYDFRYGTREVPRPLQREVLLEELDNMQVSTIPSFVILPATNLTEITEAGVSFNPHRNSNLMSWGINGDLVEFRDFAYRKDGVYSVQNPTSYFNTIKIGNPVNNTVGTVHGANSIAQGKWAYAFVVTLPTPETRVDNAYLHIKTSIYSKPNDLKLSVRIREGNKVVSTNIGDNILYSEGDVTINDYVGDDTGIINGLYGRYGVYNAFLEDILPWPDYITDKTITGYRRFKLDGVDFNNGKQKQLLFLFTAGGTGTTSILLRTYVMGVIYETIAPTSEFLLFPTRGRYYSWRAILQQYANADNPVEIIRHTRRLSNWSEARNINATGDAPNWGKAYPPASEYKELLDGSFNSPAIEPYRQIKVASQILDEGEANTDSIVESVCKDFFIVSKRVLPVDGATNSWIGNVTPPHESIIALDEPNNNAQTIITMNEKISHGEVITPDVNTVYCQPIIKYCYVHGLNRFTKSLEVHNISAPEWKAEFTPGFYNNADGEEIWNKCKKLFDKYRTFSSMPLNLQEQKWIGDYDTAVWRLNHLLDWTQKSRIDITVPWEVGRTWGVGTQFFLSLPHIRNGAELRCVIEGISKNKYSNNVKCRLIYLDSPDFDVI